MRFADTSYWVARQPAATPTTPAFVNSIAGSPRVSVRHVDETLERDAREWLRRHDERDYSFVDATSFATMRRFGLHEALAFDGDFAAAGFVELRP